jgi:gas vesicle protein
MRTRIRNTTLAAAAAAAAMLGLSGACLAVGPEDEEKVDVRVVEKAERIEIRVDGDTVEVWLNGERVPDERIKRDEKTNKIHIFDEDGNKIRELSTFVRRPLSVTPPDAPKPPKAQTFRFMVGDDEDGEGWSRVWVGEEDSMPKIAPQAPPPVMMGVFLDEPDAALRHHLGLERGRTTMIVALHEGLPAHDAGLEPYAIIIEINGSPEADPQSLQERLREMEAGDEATLTVIQEGRTREATVKLAKYDAEAMREAKVIGDAPRQIEVTTSGQFIMPEQLRKQLEGLELRQPFDDNVFFDPNAQMYQRFFDPDAIRQEISKHFSVEAKEQAERLARQAREQAREIEREVREQQRGLREKLERLADDRSDQIERLEDRMRELERMIERLIDRLDRQERSESRS